MHSLCESYIPYARRTFKAYSVWAHDVITLCTWSAANKLLVKVTPRILMTVTRLLSDGAGGDWTLVFRRLSQNSKHLYLDGFTLRLLVLAHCSTLSISSWRVWMLLAGTTMYVSSANFTSSFPGVAALRSEALTTYAAGPTVDPWTMLAVIDMQCVMCAGGILYSVNGLQKSQPASCILHPSAPGKPACQAVLSAEQCRMPCWNQGRLQQHADW